MLARLRENLSFKLLALIAAILLHAYVANQQNPSQTRSLTVPIALNHLSSGLLTPAKPGTVEVSGASAPGFITRHPSLLVPSTATATGPADDVDSVVRLVVKPDVTGATDTVDDDYQLLPVDAQGNDVANVQIEPETAHVQSGVVETGRT